MLLFSRAINKARQIWRGTDIAKAIDFSRLLRNFSSFFTNGNHPKLLIFGDSVAEWVARDDVLQKTLKELFIEQGRNFADTFVVSGRAFHTEIYFQYCRVLSKLPIPPRLVLIPINLRSFSPSWDLNPEFQYLEHIDKLKAKCEGRISFQLGVHSISPTEILIFKSIPLEYPGKPLLTVGDFHQISKDKPLSDTHPQWKVRLDHVFAFHYMFPIYKQNRKLISLCNMVELLRDMQTKVLLYITPINFEAGQKYVGNQFLELVNENIQTITDALHERGISVEGDYEKQIGFCANFAFSYPSSGFSTPHNSTEHLRFDERLSLSNRLMDIARKMIVD